MSPAAVPGPGTVSVTLRRRLGERETLDLRRPTAAELRGLPMRVLRPSEGAKSGATWGDMLGMVAGCSGLTVDELDGLAAADALRAIEALNRFLAEDPKNPRAGRIKKTLAGTALVLAHPLTLGSEKLTQLSFAECTARHLRDVPLEPGISDLLKLGGRLAAQPEAIIDRLDVDDALALIEVASSFFQDSRPTGG